MRVILTLVAISTLGCAAGHGAGGALRAASAVAQITEAIVVTAVAVSEINEAAERQRCVDDAARRERQGEPPDQARCRCERGCPR